MIGAVEDGVLDVRDPFEDELVDLGEPGAALGSVRLRARSGQSDASWSAIALEKERPTT
jgi:hypothetical protein